MGFWSISVELYEMKVNEIVSEAVEIHDASSTTYLYMYMHTMAQAACDTVESELHQTNLGVPKPITPSFRCTEPDVILLSCYRDS